MAPPTGPPRVGHPEKPAHRVSYLKGRGRWALLYHAFDRDGRLVDPMLSEHRDMAAARAFSRSAGAATGATPDRVTTDGTAPARGRSA